MSYRDDDIAPDMTDQELVDADVDIHERIEAERERLAHTNETEET
jgi:hypothetical protein